MAALQPPRNSVTDGDLVFIAGVIGNTQTHTYSHNMRKYKEMDAFKCAHTALSLCLHSGIEITHAQASQAAEKGAPSLSAC